MTERWVAVDQKHDDPTQIAGCCGHFHLTNEGAYACAKRYEFSGILKVTPFDAAVGRWAAKRKEEGGQAR